MTRIIVGVILLASVALVPSPPSPLSHRGERGSQITPRPPLPLRGEGESQNCLLPLSPRWERGLGGEGVSHSEERGSKADGVVVSVSPPANEVGAAVLKRGGNAVDAAVAVGLALAVTWPEAGNIGGGGFMLVRPASAKSDPVVIDYREVAPKAATKDLFVKHGRSRT